MITELDRTIWAMSLKLDAMRLSLMFSSHETALMMEGMRWLFTGTQQKCTE